MWFSSINQSIGSWIQKPRGNPPALPTATVSSVIQKNPATSQSTAAAVKHHQPSVTISTASATSVLLQASAAALPSRSTALPTRSTAATSHSNPPTYNGWNSLALQQVTFISEIENLENPLTIAEKWEESFEVPSKTRQKI